MLNVRFVHCCVSEMAEKDRIRYDKEKTAYQLKQKVDGQHNDDYDEDAD